VREERRCCAGKGYDTFTPSWVLHSNFGCCIGTIQKSPTYKISGAPERRTGCLYLFPENDTPSRRIADVIDVVEHLQSEKSNEL
jgi:hypothetical protein